MSEKLVPRVATAKGYYKVPGSSWRLVEKGETIYVSTTFKAKWLEEPAKPSRPTTKTDAE